ncbi:aromatic-ring-hydroxylating dioxygenase subunit beta [Govanella unica]|uniref:Aromatic-ring-hydroxylating dioxygenase subunit beta n=1 Tax=Govanella unica TaxID=2975056 RepID=A0A9X3TXG9_9PROT|nr:aromatic-ring-hydroxylating dioxygenase subunit beta [Govania unica]MDA5193499.1 aromatic-ring-hydroxylating dioxygenase subunit beta [Govania unica]
MSFDIREIETFLYDEADCLDRADLEAWMALYTEDGTYWMPASPNQTSPTTEISIIYDDRLLMEIRRLNYGHELAASMAYAVRSSHLIGNVRITTSNADSCEVSSNFQVALFYRGEQTLYAGRYNHALIKTGDGWKIRHKRVDLLTCDQPLKSLVIYL